MPRRIASRSILLAAALAACSPGTAEHPELARWERQARNVTITRDDWGIPHIHGKTDADAVFGLMYAQAEDDFNRVETNFLNSMGRLAEAEGERQVIRDLRMKLFIRPDSMQVIYSRAPAWLQALMDAWADGLNYYLTTHPEVKPRVLTRFEPWMALSFSEGSIGGDIERVSLPNLRAFYDSGSGAAAEQPGGDGDGDREPRGSNGIAIAPKNTEAGRALLWINPHTSFFFRSEVQVTSDEGLNAYGAVTWGQFFIYQGFNETAGWMHTSSRVDNIDEYLETVTRTADGYTYKHGTEQRPILAETIVVPFKTDTGMARKTFTVYRTHHGPVVREKAGKWISVRMMEEPLKALTQSFTRTKARNLKEFRETMELHTNSSNNTLFADAEGNIAYFHANFVPKRATGFNWREPVDGSDPATEWQGVHGIDESPNVFNPATGWVFNTNNWPYSAAGPDSPKESAYPGYFNTTTENPRGVHALRVLTGKTGFTPASLIQAAFDSYLPAMAELIPPLLADYDRLAGSNPLKARLKEQAELLRGWDFRWGEQSVATSLAVFFADTLEATLASAATRAKMDAHDFAVTRASAPERLTALAAASDRLAADFGKWQTPWGEINRFQRLTGDIEHPYSDSGPSIPVPFTSARWGSLASFGARTYPGTRKLYGYTGNSFLAVVEFGDSVRARAVTAGGASGHPADKHFNDQAARYAAGDLREVYFYPGQLKAHTERRYHPGEH